LLLQNLPAQVFVDSVVKNVESHVSSTRANLPRRESVSEPSTIDLTTKDLSQFSSVAKLIEEQVPGVTVRTNGGIGSYSRLSIRGISGERVAVYIDDVLLNSSSNGCVNLNSLPLSLFTRAEVYKGSLSIDMPGTNSGGAIKLYTDNGENGNSVNGSFSVGSYGYLSAVVGAALLKPSYTMVLNGSYEGADNDFTYYKNPTPYNLSNEYEATRINDTSFSIRSSLFVRKTLQDMSRLSAKINIGGSRKGLAGSQVSANDEAWISENLFSGECDWSLPPLSVSELKLQVKGRFNRTETYYPQKIISYSTSRIIHRIDDEYGIEGNGISELKFNDKYKLTMLLSAGMEEYIPFDKRVVEPLSISASRINGAAGAAVELLNAKVAPYLRIRYDATGYSADPIMTDEFSLNSTDGKTEVIHVLSGSIGCSYKLNIKSNLGVSFSRRKQLPSFYQMFGDRGLSLGNPELKPEDLRLGEFFFRTEYLKGVLKLNIEFSAYYNYSLDAIVSYTYMTGGQIRWMNADASSNKGIEIVSVAALSDKCELSINATIQNPVNHSKYFYADAYDGKRMPGESKYTLAPKLELNVIRNIDLWFSARIQGDYYTDTFNDKMFHYFPSSQIYNCGLMWNAFKAAELYFKVENITDIKNYDAFGHPVPGRMFIVGAHYRITAINKN
jgi:iron complex outermembrane receptor protein